MTIRQACSYDIDAMVLLLEALFGIEDDFTIDPQLQRQGLLLLLSSPDAVVLVAEESGSVIGMVSMQSLVSTAIGGRVGLIEDMIVNARYRGSGIGGKLLTSMIDEADKRGFSRIALGVDLRNENAIGFYRWHGFSSGNMGLMYLYL